MSYADQAFNLSMGQTMSKIHTGFPASVVAYNEVEHTATVQPLYKFDEQTNYPQLQGVPVSKYRYKIMKSKGISESAGDHLHSYSGTTQPAAGPGTHSHSYSGNTGNAGDHTHVIEEEEVIEEIKLFLYPGDIVWCVCSEKSMDSAQSGQVHKPQSDRVFDVSDAVIVCLLY